MFIYGGIKIIGNKWIDYTPFRSRMALKPAGEFNLFPYSNNEMELICYCKDFL